MLFFEEVNKVILELREALQRLEFKVDLIGKVLCKDHGFPMD